MTALTDDDVARFVRDGAVALRGAVPPDLVATCRSVLWQATGADEHDPTTWTQPVVRVPWLSGPPFVAAGNTPALHAAFDRLAGPGRWQRLGGLGTFPVRFPPADPSVPVDPGDAGWHLEATGAGPDGRMVVDPGSRERVLLALFLFSDTGDDDAPTRVRLGSHRAAARALSDADGPSDWLALSQRLAAETDGLPEVAATGAAGDVWLCHPFVVHAAQPHRGTRVRFLAQPPVPGTGPLDPTRSDPSPVERAVA